MRFVLLSCLMVVLSFGVVFPDDTAARSSDGARIEGRITDADTGEPLQGVHVFLSGTKIGTATRPSGQFLLDGIPPGHYRLVVSMIGYGQTVTEVSFGEQERKFETIRLEPVVYDLGELYAGNLDDRWERHLERFTRLFIGETPFADSVEIMNPEVLRFETRWWGRFTAEALAPLQIKNHALGYEIRFHLDEFFHSGNRTRWDGEPLFFELSPESEEQLQQWERNREQAFRGSMRHFLISLIEGRTEEEGFRIYRRDRFAQTTPYHNSFPARPSRLIRDADEDHLHRMRFSGRLEIIYTRAGEDRRFLNWLQDYSRGPASVQTSHLELNRRPVTVDTNGEVMETYGTTRFGYFSYLRVADAVPKEYRPAEFEERVASGEL